MLKRKQKLPTLIFGIFLFAVTILPVTVLAQDYEDSPFGFNTLFGGGSNNPSIVEQTLTEQFSELNDLGISWIRGVCLAGVEWWRIEPTEGNFNFELSDILMVQAHNSGISFLPMILPYNEWVQDCYGNNPDPFPFPYIYCEGYEEDYINYVKEVVERYDGDEDFGNYAISEEIKNAIRNSPWLYWEIMNEPFNHYFEGTSDEYEQILDVSYNAIKEKSQNCNVLIAGYSQEVYYAGVYGTNPGGQSIPQGMQDTANGFLQIPFNSNSYDIMNIHVYATTDLIAEQYNYYNQQNVWMTEVGYPSIEVPIPNTNPPLIWAESTSEKVQAETLIKRFVVGLNAGIKKIFWHTWHDDDIAPFGNTGIITSQGHSCPV